MAKKPNSANSVGYGRPPQASQFKPGRSGNPKGRPKGSRNFSSALQKALSEKVTVTENGKARKLPKRSVVAKQVVHKAATGDLRAASLLMADARAQDAQEALAPRPSRPLDENDEEVLAATIERMRQYQPPLPAALPRSDTPVATSDRLPSKRPRVRVNRPMCDDSAAHSSPAPTAASDSPNTSTTRIRRELHKR